MKAHPEYRKNTMGFTFIEMLIVLSIVVVISLITFLKLTPLVEQKNIDHFFEQFTDDLLFAQMFAMSHGQSAQVIFSETNPSYKILSNDTILIYRQFHSKFEINTGTLGAQFFYRSNGNISNSGSIYFSFGDREFRVVFLLGKGRFYVTEI